MGETTTGNQRPREYNRCKSKSNGQEEISKKGKGKRQRKRKGNEIRQGKEERKEKKISKTIKKQGAITWIAKVAPGTAKAYT